jgi:maltose O-acetyltransferase
MERTELEKMLAGELYSASDPELVLARQRARRITRLFNATTEEEIERRTALLSELFGAAGPGVDIEPPFRCDYGSNIRLGERVYMNFGCVILDDAPVTIGEGVLLGPSVHIYAATHPIDPDVRKTGRELALPVTIGDNVWIGGGVRICPGVTIGSNTTIGAGSVVVRDVPPGVLAVGNPCRIVRLVSRR